MQVQMETIIKPKNNLKALFSSKKMDWETSDAFFARLSEKWHFTLDPCANPLNTKCAKYFTEEDDGLTQDWGGHTAFVNPPYGRQIGKWVKKCYEESHKPNTTVVMLIPSRTDTKYWHRYVMKASEIFFVKGRIKFVDNGVASPAPFPSAVVVFRHDAWHTPNQMPTLGVVENV